MKKVIITGGNGFIGTHLVKKLLSNNEHSLVIISNTAHSRNRFLEDIKLVRDDTLAFYNADIRDRKTISNIFIDESVDTCIHLAAKKSVADSIENPDETSDINVNGTISVLEACAKSQIKNFIFASSAAVYGRANELPISEGSGLNPLSAYGKSKMIAERHIYSYVRSKKILNAVTLRIFNVYGPGQSDESDVITRFASRLSKQLPPIIYGNGLHTRDFISVDDVVESVLSSIKFMEERGRKRGGDLRPCMVFNIGTGIPTCMKELAKKMIEIFGLNLEPFYDREKVDSKVILHSYADMTRTSEILHFVPKIRIDEGLREVIKPLLLRK